MHRGDHTTSYSHRLLCTWIGSSVICDQRCHWAILATCTAFQREETHHADTTSFLVSYCQIISSLPWNRSTIPYVTTLHLPASCAFSTHLSSVASTLLFFLVFRQGYKCVPYLNHCFPVQLNSFDAGFRVTFLFTPHRSSKTGTQLTALLHSSLKIYCCDSWLFLTHSFQQLSCQKP